MNRKAAQAATVFILTVLLVAAAAIGLIVGIGYLAVNGHQWVIAIPAGLLVLHKCDNPACVNPDHLYLGTQKENAKDRDGRGRWCRQRRMNPEGTRPAGCSHRRPTGGKSAAEPMTVSQMRWPRPGGNMKLKALIEELRQIQRSSHSQLLEADTSSPVIGRVNAATREAADALQEWYDNLKKMGYPGLDD